MLALLAEDLPFPCSVFYSYNEWIGKLVCECSHGIPDSLKREFDLQEGLVGQAITDGHPLEIEASEQFPFLVETGVASIKPQGILVQPILYQEKIMGVLVTGSIMPFSQYDRDFMGRIATNLGIALQNLKQYSDLKDLSKQLKLRGRDIATKNKQLEDANRMKSEFLANMSHELRTPLNAIIGFSEVLKDQVMGDMNETQLEYTTDIFTSGQHLLSLINDILDLSKIEAGMMVLDLGPVKVRSMLESSLTVIKEKAMNHRIELQLEIEDGIDEMVADARKLKQIVYNLLANAVKFTPDGGTVSIEAMRVPGTAKDGLDSLQVSIIDTGIGISQKDINRLFQAFVQVDGTYSRKYEGTGLGLAMVKQLVELHGGTVSVTSEVDQGSTFTVQMPYRDVEDFTPAAETQQPALPAVSPTHHPAPGDTLVLIIEDDDQAAGLLRLQLEENGYRTIRAATAEQGLTMAAEHRPDLITLDMMMPEMDGLTFLEYKAKSPEFSDIPVLVISAATDVGKISALGTQAVLKKPLRRGELLQVLDSLGLTVGKGNTLKILLVDDDPQAIKILSTYFNSAEYEVLKEYGGRAGLEAARQNHPDVIILDLMMPEMNGFQVLKELKKEPDTSDIPVIILTAKILTQKEKKDLITQAQIVIGKAQLTREGFLLEVRKLLKSNIVNNPT